MCNSYSNIMLEDNNMDAIAAMSCHLNQNLRQLTFTFKRIIDPCSPPALLDKTRAASFTLLTTGVVFTVTQQLCTLCFRRAVTWVGMAIAHTAPSDGDIFDAVVILEDSKSNENDITGLLYTIYIYMHIQ